MVGKYRSDIKYYLKSASLKLKGPYRSNRVNQNVIVDLSMSLIGTL